MKTAGGKEYQSLVKKNIFRKKLQVTIRVSLTTPILEMAALNF